LLNTVGFGPIRGLWAFSSDDGTGFVVSGTQLYKINNAYTATLIGNDHIIDVTDMGDLPDGSPFLVMEFLAGSPLASLCERPMPVRRTVHIARQICSALGAAHDKGIIHRDLKPENVFLVERNGDPDFVKVLDFGISKMHSSGVDKGLTRTGMAMGTPSYMSPEQAQGSKNLDHRTDVWALGVILYEMLASRRPFDADSYPLLLMNIVATDPDPIGWYRKDLPPAFADVVMRCLAKAPDARIGSMRDLSEALAPFASFDIEVEIARAPGVEHRRNAEQEARQAVGPAREPPLQRGEKDQRQAEAKPERGATQAAAFCAQHTQPRDEAIVVAKRGQRLGEMAEQQGGDDGDEGDGHPVWRRRRVR
jgi:serine/threonine-protein kinase